MTKELEKTMLAGSIKLVCGAPTLLIFFRNIPGESQATIAAWEFSVSWLVKNSHHTVLSNVESKRK